MSGQTLKIKLISTMENLRQISY